MNKNKRHQRCKSISLIKKPTTHPGGEAAFIMSRLAAHSGQLGDASITSLAFVGENSGERAWQKGTYPNTSFSGLELYL